MRVAVDFQDERVDLDVPDEALVGSWHGPRGRGADEVPALIAEALEHPREFPSLRQALVPGDRVVIALGDDVPEAPAVLGSVYRVLENAGIEPGGVVVLTGPQPRAKLADAVPAEVTFLKHDPDDPNNLAYLAATTGERRVYLNRALTDADFVLPVGRLGYDPALGYEGPWGVIFPGLSDQKTRAEFRANATGEPPDPLHPKPALTESAEVSWLLGIQFQVGVVAGVSGVVGAVAGLGSAVLEHGAREVDRAWVFRADSRAELVVAGIGRPGVSTGIDDVARGLSTAVQLVRRGGKIVILSRAAGPISPTVRRLINAGDPHSDMLDDHDENDGENTSGKDDDSTARMILRAVEWADVYLLSGFSADDVEELSIIPLERPEEAGRLAKLSDSCLVLSQADLARAEVADEPN